MNIEAYAEEYLAARPTVLLEKADVAKFFVEAATEYAAWGTLLCQKKLEVAAIKEEGDCIKFLWSPAPEGFRLILNKALTAKSYFMDGDVKKAIYNAQGNAFKDDDTSSRILNCIPAGEGCCGYICLDVATALDAKMRLTTAEWGAIKVLGYLLVEKESALIQESSRVASHEPYGRNSSEVEQEITNFRNEYFRQWAFSYAGKTI